MNTKAVTNNQTLVYGFRFSPSGGFCKSCNSVSVQKKNPTPEKQKYRTFVARVLMVQDCTDMEN